MRTREYPRLKFRGQSPFVAIAPCAATGSTTGQPPKLLLAVAANGAGAGSKAGQPPPKLLLAAAANNQIRNGAAMPDEGLEADQTAGAFFESREGVITDDLDSGAEAVWISLFAFTPGA